MTHKSMLWHNTLARVLIGPKTYLAISSLLFSHKI